MSETPVQPIVVNAPGGVGFPSAEAVSPLAAPVAGLMAAHAAGIALTPTAQVLLIACGTGLAAVFGAGAIVKCVLASRKSGGAGGGAGGVGGNGGSAS